jgi:hypothetical protein
MEHPEDMLPIRFHWVHFFIGGEQHDRWIVGGPTPKEERFGRLWLEKSSVITGTNFSLYSGNHPKSKAQNQSQSIEIFGVGGF